MRSACGGQPDLADRPDADVVAAGAVLWRAGGAGPEVAVVHRPRYDDWSLPKGKAGRGEILPATAVREVAEETGCRSRLALFLGDVHYRVPEGRKAVRFWSAEALGGTGVFTANDETDDVRWLPVADAAVLLSYDHERAVLHRFGTLGPPTSVLVVVRHAKAGSRRQWDGDDRDRPLSSTGRDQAERLGALLALLGPDRLTSSPPARCRDSLAPAARALGRPLVGVEPLIGEEEFAADPGAGLARIRELAVLPGVTVLCSQGGVIPAAVADLVRRAARPVGVDPDDVPSRKASTWVLALRGERLVGADYFSRPTG